MRIGSTHTEKIIGFLGKAAWLYENENENEKENDSVADQKVKSPGVTAAEICHLPCAIMIQITTHNATVLSLTLFRGSALCSAHCHFPTTATYRHSQTDHIDQN
jgi:hypothetical protein